MYALRRLSKLFLRWTLYEALTEYQTSANLQKKNAEDKRITTWACQSEAKRKQAPQSEANVCRRRRRKCNLKKTSLINCTGHPTQALARSARWLYWTWNDALRCFDTLFRRPYWCFSIAFKVILFFSDRDKIFTNEWLWIEVCQNAVVSKIDITMTTINKKTLKSIKSAGILRDLDLLGCQWG